MLTDVGCSIPSSETEPLNFSGWKNRLSLIEQFALVWWKGKPKLSWVTNATHILNMIGKLISIVTIYSIKKKMANHLTPWSVPERTLSNMYARILLVKNLHPGNLFSPPRIAMRPHLPSSSNVGCFSAQSLLHKCHIDTQYWDNKTFFCYHYVTYENYTFL